MKLASQPALHQTARRSASFPFLINREREPQVTPQPTWHECNHSGIRRRFKSKSCSRAGRNWISSSLRRCQLSFHLKWFLSPHDLHYISGCRCKHWTVTLKLPPLPLWNLTFTWQHGPISTESYLKLITHVAVRRELIVIGGNKWRPSFT